VLISLISVISGKVLVIDFFRGPLRLRVSVVQFSLSGPLFTLFLCVEGLFLLAAQLRCILHGLNFGNYPITQLPISHAQYA